MMRRGRIEFGGLGVHLSQYFVGEFDQFRGSFFCCRPRCARYSNDSKRHCVATSRPTTFVGKLLAVCEDIAPEKQNPLFAGDVPAKACRSDGWLRSANSIPRLY